MYSMKEVSKKMDLPAHTLRYYEESGILTDIARNENGQRLYNDYNLQQINLIKWLWACSLSITEIRSFFDSLRAHMPAAERVNILKEHHQYLDKKQQELADAVKLLEIKIDYFSKQE